ncbi:hypothetical protein ANCDUO_09687 [Ancylostoma duodenale]|uniref:Uncharacterized protein n=1 Tax=Ancylostoma duodenale TaxID=51022 RepID=A0A0C2CT65_9BILA|nr:hypothetical protein ANCDUO_09687 [Ancylostoma duodenale]
MPALQSKTISCSGILWLFCIGTGCYVVQFGVVKAVRNSPQHGPPAFAMMNLKPEKEQETWTITPTPGYVLKFTQWHVWVKMSRTCVNAPA